MYDAEIEEIDEENGTAAITFISYGNAEVIPLQHLKPLEEGKLRDEDGKPKSRYGSSARSHLHLHLPAAVVIVGLAGRLSTFHQWFHVLFSPLAGAFILSDAHIAF